MSVPILLLFSGISLALLLLPLHLQADLHHGVRRVLRVQVRLAFLRQCWQAESLSNASGRELLLTHGPGTPRRIRAGAQHHQTARRLLHSLRTSKALRQILRHGLTLRQLDAQLLLHTGNASATALLTGALQTLFTHLPRHWRGPARWRILPDFLHDHSTLQVRCIFTLRLGTMLIIACLLLGKAISQGINREVHKLWNTPSVN